MKGTLCWGEEEAGSKQLPNAALGALIFSSLAALSLECTLALLCLLTTSAEGLKEKDTSEAQAAASCGAGGIFNTMPEKKGICFLQPSVKISAVKAL